LRVSCHPLFALTATRPCCPAQFAEKPEGFDSDLSCCREKKKESWVLLGGAF